ncbi:hypothetical protein M758_1G150100 [Ceratodon purpureus]|uniref:Uncharacterized protein n=1 Tax=Ceratodon purpureus TaxID=3225 RepID=A0A8T0J5E4_CERPU|nr:hypothetical protein KC19_1G153100 [Ceratodon purpureus]KAG0630042.1 hypothetical protein M758_1G150100 [Ceratodon purpureus]
MKHHNALAYKKEYQMLAAESPSQHRNHPPPNRIRINSSQSPNSPKPYQNPRSPSLPLQNHNDNPVQNFARNNHLSTTTTCNFTQTKRTSSLLRNLHPNIHYSQTKTLTLQDDTFVSNQMQLQINHAHDRNTCIC